jgi:hypothetical protein
VAHLPNPPSPSYLPDEELIASQRDGSIELVLHNGNVTMDRIEAEGCGLDVGEPDCGETAQRGVAGAPE